MSYQDTKACANVIGYIPSEPAGMSSLYLLLLSAIKFCSVFSANNPTVNDASSVTMLSVRSCSRGGDDFLVCRQNNNSALHVSFPLIFSN